MAMQKKFDIVFSGEKYTTRDGEEKTRFVNMGAVFERDDGSLCAKIESLPVGFTGWVNFYEPREREQTHGGQQQSGQQRQASSAGREYQQRRENYTPPAGGFADDDIPF